jgi:hypothetical protein
MDQSRNEKGGGGVERMRDTIKMRWGWGGGRTKRWYRLLGWRKESK